MSDSVIINKKIKRRIKAIFSHPYDVYSIYFNDSENVVWIEGKVALYEYLQKLENEISKRK